MIIPCPSCQTKFEVADHLMMPEGRKVRCKACGHVWFQDVIAGEDDLVEEKSEGLPSFMDQVQEADDDHHIQQNDWEDDEKESRLARLISFIKEKTIRLTDTIFSPKIAKIAFFILGFGLASFAGYHKLIVNKNDMVLHTPSAYNVYRYIGIEDVIPAGEGLIFQDMTAKWSDAEQNKKPALMMNGTIFNSKDTPQHIPPIKATILLATGMKGDSHVHRLEQPIIEPQKSKELSFEIPSESASGNDILLNFDVEALN